MRGIARLLFGDGEDFDDEAGRLLGRLLGNDDERAMGDRVRRAGEWCGTTPGTGSGGSRRPRPGIEIREAD
ncbi:MAG TPA: hypothetical protein VHV09_10805 [Trebonia sp.]|jgi:hypothetical protein|nr:hypothetical protein [Trebonia sp.]